MFQPNNGSLSDPLNFNQAIPLEGLPAVNVRLKIFAAGVAAIEDDPFPDYLPILILT